MKTHFLVNLYCGRLLIVFYRFAQYINILIILLGIKVGNNNYLF